MNSDPYDSAAWRTFNMLDADEATLFDQDMREDRALRSAYLEMNRLSAAIAATVAPPLKPKDDQLERLQTRLKLIPAHRSHFWMAVSGWSAALVLAILLGLHLTGVIDPWTTRNQTVAATSQSPQDPARPTTPADPSNKNPPVIPGQGADNGDLATPGTPAAGKEPDGKSTAKVETKRLNQEIEVLRENLQKFQNRDRALFDVVPGMAVPIVMTMTPPGIAAEDPAIFAKNDEHSPITTLLGDALTALTGVAAANTGNPAAGHANVLTSLPEHPTAIPIYDAARDLGTLVVSNLPPAAEGQVYNLWVTTETGGQPIFVGGLPEKSASGADSFDFSLGSTMVLPSGFVLTIDPLDAPATPTAANTVLHGPPTPAR